MRRSPAMVCAVSQLMSSAEGEIKWILFAGDREVKCISLFLGADRSDIVTSPTENQIGSSKEPTINVSHQKNNLPDPPHYFQRRANLWVDGVNWRDERPHHPAGQTPFRGVC